jgi:membrane protease YdiL (CAAX protease family)
MKTGGFLVSSRVVDSPTREAVLEGRPIAAAILLAIAFAAVAALATLVLGAGAPSLEGKNRDLVVELILAVFVLAIIAALRWRRDVGLVGPAEWRHLGLLIVPAVVVLIPFLGGFDGDAASGIGVLLAGYALNSIAEDGMFSGILPRVLRSRGLVWAVVLSALLFGLVHFGNVISRPDQSIAITAAQAVGVFSGGIGFISIRLVTRSVIPVMAVHYFLDLFLQLGGLPVVLANVIQSVILLIFGIVILRRYRREIADAGWE